LYFVPVLKDSPESSTDASKFQGLWQDMWNDHYTETYWHFYNVYTQWLTSTEGQSDDNQFAHDLQEAQMAPFSAEFIKVPVTDGEQTGGAADQEG
jgi:hypothetical protein